MVCPLKPDHMSRAGTLQRRTTYLISLTLVKVEAVEEDGAQVARGIVLGRKAGGEDVVGGASDDGEQPFPDEEEETELEEEEEGEEDSLSEPGRETVESPVGESAPAGSRRNRTPTEVCVYPRARDQPVARERPSPSAPVIDAGNSGFGDVGGDTEREETTEGCRGSPKPCWHTDAANPCCTPTKSSIPVRIGQRPGTLLKAHSDAVSRRELKEAREGVASGRAQPGSPASPVTGLSWPPWIESESKASSHQGPDGPKYGDRAVGGAMGGTAMSGAVERTTGGEVQGSWGVGDTHVSTRDSPRTERLKAGSTSLPAPLTLVPKHPRKGKSRTLDNSDLHSLSKDLRREAESLVSPGVAPSHASGPAQLQSQAQRASVRDRKMLKFISGIFTKSTPVPASPASAPPPQSSIQRESSEEDGKTLSPNDLPSPAFLSYTERPVTSPELHQHFTPLHRGVFSPNVHL